MQCILNFIIIFGDLAGLILFTCAIIRWRQLKKEFDKYNDNDFLSEIDKKRLNQCLLYMLTGFCISAIVSLTKVITLILNKLL